jgi:hypothetical protein
MSTIYHTEPPTQGKVLIQTTFGDVGNIIMHRQNKKLYTVEL